jgi:Domain of unknown function (DUF1707)
MTRTQTGCPVGQMRASDADRDAVLAQLSEHFQAGRLTPDELEDRTGRALGARTIGGLDALTIDLPVPERREPGRQPVPRGRPHPAVAPVVLALIAIAAVGSVLTLGTGHRGWSAWWVIPVALIIARRLAGRRGIGPEGTRDQR